MRRPHLAVLLTAVLMITACGSSELPPPSEPSPSSAVRPATTNPGGSVAAVTATPSSDPEPRPIDDFRDVGDAVIQIDTSDIYRHHDPEVGWVPGRDGSGFIIDPTGLALTNYHVLAGATSATVWLGDDRQEYQADVIAVSECSDVGLIQLDGGGEFAWLDWYEGDIERGLDVYAAGYPLAEPEFTLTGGIVSRERSTITEQWAWVLETFEHDANILGGNSGGPVVTEDARVLGINYAGSELQNRSIAISRDEVVPLLDELLAGESVASLGIAGYAVTDEERSGVWVQDVRADSPAADAGLLPGDLLTELDGLSLATDETMSSYCRVIREHEAGDTIPFTIYRDDSRETLAAEFNGDPLVPGFSFATTIGTDVDPVAAAMASARDVWDESFGVTFLAPDTWPDTTDRPWTTGGVDVGPGVVAAIDVQAFRDGWVTPGAYVAASAELPEDRTVDAILDADRPAFQRSCTLVGRESFQRGRYTGRYDLWEACGGSSSRFLTIAGADEEGSVMVYAQFQAVSDQDLAALDRILTTLEVDLSTEE